MAYEDGVEERWAATEHFRARQGQQLDRFHAACEAVRNARQSHNVRGSCQQESARAVIVVNRFLDGQHELRSTLDLIDDCKIKTVHERDRVGSGCFEGRLIVKRQVHTTAIAHRPGYRRLARSARSGEENNRRIAESLDKASANEAFVQARSSHRHPAIKNTIPGD